MNFFELFSPQAVIIFIMSEMNVGLPPVHYDDLRMFEFALGNIDRRIKDIEEEFDLFEKTYFNEDKTNIRLSLQYKWQTWAYLREAYNCKRPDLQFYSLQSLRDMLGPQDYYAGKMP